MKPNELSEAAAALGRKGGKSTSQAKVESVRANGRKGGRPRVVHYEWGGVPICGSKAKDPWMVECDRDPIRPDGTIGKLCPRCERKWGMSEIL